MMADEAAGRFQLGGMRAPPTQIPFVVMTSPLNHSTTASYFAENGYFGLKEEQVRFFPQGTLPALTPEGKIVMTNGSTLSEVLKNKRTRPAAALAVVHSAGLSILMQTSPPSRCPRRRTATAASTMRCA